MATSRYCPSCLSNASPLSLLRPAARPQLITPLLQHQVRTAAGGKSSNKGKRDRQTSNAPKKKTSNQFKLPKLKEIIQFPLLDAMRYLRAFEVGRAPTSSKYELHVRLRTLKNGPVIRNRIRLPHPVKTDLRICVIAPSTGPIATQALTAGATIVGEEEVFEQIKAGNLDFDRCICHQDSLQKLTKSGVARILGPRGLMPSVKTRTVVKDVKGALAEMGGAAEYRERLGVVRIAVGQLGFTPEELAKNVRTFMEKISMDCAIMQTQISKDVHEVVLSSTNGPGFSLNGDFRGEGSVPTKDLMVL